MHGVAGAPGAADPLAPLPLPSPSNFPPRGAGTTQAHRRRVRRARVLDQLLRQPIVPNVHLPPALLLAARGDVWLTRRYQVVERIAHRAHCDHQVQDDAAPDHLEVLYQEALDEERVGEMLMGRLADGPMTEEDLELWFMEEEEERILYIANRAPGRDVLLDFYSFARHVVRELLAAQLFFSTPSSDPDVPEARMLMLACT